MMLANMFLFGSIERPCRSYISPAEMLTGPFKDRIEYLISHIPGADQRPDFDGDFELQTIYRDLQKQEQC